MACPIGKGHTQIGLMDIAIHPDFSNNHRIYFSYARPHPESGKYHVTEVATGVLADGKLNNLKTLINSQDFGWAPANFGGALEFDNNNFLYITIGDRGEDVLSRRGDRLEGKMLRLNAEDLLRQTIPLSTMRVTIQEFMSWVYGMPRACILIYPRASCSNASMGPSVVMR